MINLFRTLRFRFAFWTANLFTIVLVAFGAYIYFSMERGLSAELDNYLALNASQVIAGLEVENGQLVLTEHSIESVEEDMPLVSFNMRILTPSGQVLHQTGKYASQLGFIENSSQNPYFTTLNEPPMRVHNAPIEDDNQLIAFVQVAQSLENIQDTLERLRMTLLLSIPLLVLVAGVSGYFLAARALRPIDAMIRTARRISAEDLSARINLPGDDEVGRLSITFDEMLSRLDESFRRQRRFTADASHELRTPLAAMEAIISVIRQRRRTAAGYEKALDDLSEETGRMRVLIENLLALSRSDLHPIAQRKSIHLSNLLTDVVESMYPLAKSKGLSLTKEIAPDLTLIADSDSLIRLFVNLIDNAIKYTEQGSLTVTAQCKREAIHIEICDTGIGIPEEHLAHIFERFYRVDPSRSASGAGLGLSIVQEIVRNHNGAIQVKSTVGKGSTFILELPC